MFWLRNKKNNFQFRTLIWRPENVFLSICLQVSSTDNLCKQFGIRSGPKTPGLVWIQTWLWYSWKNFFKTLILKKSRRQKKAWKITSRQRVLIISPPKNVLKLEAISDSCLYKTKKGHDLIGCPQFFLLQFDNKDTADRILRWAMNWHYFDNYFIPKQGSPYR